MSERVLVVTGGGRGIGAAVCRLAARHGYRVVVDHASGGAAADGVWADIEAAGGTAVTVAGDVADEADVWRLFDVAAGLGELAGLVSNAGTTGNTPGRLDEQDAAVVRRVHYAASKAAVDSLTHGSRSKVLVASQRTVRTSGGLWLGAVTVP